MFRSLIHLAAPFATALLLMGMSTADKLRIDPHEADAFHAKAALAIEKMPKILGSGSNSWYLNGKDIPLPTDAAGLLKPNAYLHRIYVNPDHRHAEMLLVQCRDTRDMQGHYPPICYPSAGCSIDKGKPQTWLAGALSVTGTEYVIVWPDKTNTTVRNFFVLPNGRIVRDMDSVIAAAKDYRELVYGVTQIQILFDASVGEAERDEIFAGLIGPNQDLIATLRKGILQ
jgi:hypothetical protein